MRKEIALSTPNLNMEIVDNLRECIETGWVSTGGRFIAEFEDKIAGYLNINEAVSMQSGSAGLHMGLKVLGIKPGDEVIVPTLTFIAAVNPVVYIGAHPVFMDCNESFCLDTEKLEQFLKEECKREADGLINRTTGRKITAIIPVHVFGNLCDMDRIMSLAREYGLKVMEDATEALGSYYESGPYKGKFAGTIGDVGVYSFNANKIITTGGGGMLVSRRQEYLEHARFLSVQAKTDALYFVHDEVGYNYRMLNLQAALGVSQIDQLERFIEIKKRNFNLYSNLLNPVDGLKMLPFGPGRVNHWFYSLQVDSQKFGCNRNTLMDKLISQGIQCRPVWKLIHTQKPYVQHQAFKIINATFFEENILNIPCSTDLTEEDVEYVAKQIMRIRG